MEYGLGNKNTYGLAVLARDFFWKSLNIFNFFLFEEQEVTPWFAEYKEYKGQLFC